MLTIAYNDPGDARGTLAISSSEFYFSRLVAFTSVAFDPSKPHPKPPAVQSRTTNQISPYGVMFRGELTQGRDSCSRTSATLFTISYTSAGGPIPFYSSPPWRCRFRGCRHSTWPRRLTCCGTIGGILERDEAV
ncbi:hypothetical protein HDF14_001554 [Edaphobacter lichenicola]|uniref:Uncharacterized protein n=1 Tax=Tunturiibacter gelidiferens TaxID=3069689 RepID=A0A9X0QCR1_9BACT|nr:hypothetical protein [Edaphobacter lichenicola]